MKAEFSANVQGFIFIFYLPMIVSYLFHVANILGKNSYDHTNLWNLVFHRCSIYAVCYYL